MSKDFIVQDNRRSIQESTFTGNNRHTVAESSLATKQVRAKEGRREEPRTLRSSRARVQSDIIKVSRRMVNAPGFNEIELD